MAVVQTWDGANRRIYLHVDTANASWNPVDLYREYRIERRTNEAFRKWEPFLRMEGNVPKGGGKATPRYMTLLGGVKIIPYDMASVTTVTGEIITDDQTSPFDYSTLTNPAVVNVSPADAEIVYVEIPSPIQDNLDYMGYVVLNASTGMPGTTHPAGTWAQPVDNMADAVTVAAAYGLQEIHFTGTVLCGTTALNSMHLYGRGPRLDVIVFQGGHATVSGWRMTATGVMGSSNGSFFIESIIANLYGVRGGALKCILAGTIQMDVTETSSYELHDCQSAERIYASPVIDMNGSVAALNVRNYHGALTIANFTQGATAHVSLSSGVVTLAATCTSGTVYVEGIGRVVDHLGNELVSGTYNGGVTLVNDCVSPVKLDEMWKLQGLDSANPASVSTTARSAGAINLAITGSPDTSLTVTRS